MDKSFDELFNEFFNPRSNFDAFERMRQNVKDYFDSMFNSSNITNFSNEEGEQMVEKLGKPDKIRYFTDKGVYIEEKIWHTDKGDFISRLASDNPNFFGENISFENIAKPKKPEKPLELQLEEALEKEDYEKAAEIRDLMSPPKKKRGRPKKVEK
jgi:hypothetical protein